MWGRDTFAMAVSSSSMNVAKVTVIAISHGLTLRSRTAPKGMSTTWVAILLFAVLLR